MMTSLSQPYSPHPVGIQQHPGVPQGHPMAGVPHSQGQQVQPGMPQQMHMGVSGPGGPQVTQAGAMMGGMPPGAGGPSAHALQHLNPGQAQQSQAQIYQQQAMFANNPQMQQLQQQQLIQHQRQQAARQALMSQQYSGMPMGVPNGMSQMTPAQFNAMRGGPMARSVNLPQHLQQAQQQAQHTMEQAQAQQHAQQHAHQQQQLIAQQMAMQQQAQAQGGNPGQQGQMNPQQIQNLQQAQMAAAQQQHQQAQAAQAAAAAQQQNQGQQQSQPQNQQSQPNAQSQPQQSQPQGQQQQGGMPQQQAAVAAAMLQQQQQRQGEKLKGQCLRRLMQFGDYLSNFGVNSKPLQAYMTSGAHRVAAQGIKQRDDLNYWLAFVDRFFSPRGVLRHSVWIVDETSNKQYEITFPALARYFHTHFESGIKNIQLIMERGSEKELPNNGHYIESPKSSFVYWFENGSQLIASGILRAHFDAEQKIELLEFVTSSHEEYLPRVKVIEAARPWHDWGKEWQRVNNTQSPEMKKKAKHLKSPPQPPPDFDLPLSKIKPNMGITPSVFQFLELAEVMGQMNPLFNYSHLNSTLKPYAALDTYVASVSQNGNNPSNQGQPPTGPRTPGMSNFPIGASPGTAHLQLPDGSPHISSPAQAPGMQLQQSQHGTSSSGPSANTSPNANTKRRRPSTVKNEEENQVNGTQNKASVKPSPRSGGKRQKVNPA